MKAIYEAIMNDTEYVDPTENIPFHVAQPAPVPEPSALQLAQEGRHVIHHWYTDDDGTEQMRAVGKMHAYAALASAEALTRLAEVLETLLDEIAKAASGNGN